MNKTKSFILNFAMWIGISLVVSILISFFVPSPYSLIGIIALLVLMGYYLRNIRIVGGKHMERTY